MKGAGTQLINILKRDGLLDVVMVIPSGSTFTFEDLPATLPAKGAASTLKKYELIKKVHGGYRTTGLHDKLVKSLKGEPVGKERQYKYAAKILDQLKKGSASQSAMAKALKVHPIQLKPSLAHLAKKGQIKHTGRGMASRWGLAEGQEV